jgi:hypothetical protein
MASHATVALRTLLSSSHRLITLISLNVRTNLNSLMRRKFLLTASDCDTTDARWDHGIDLQCVKELPIDREIIIIIMMIIDVMCAVAY